MAGLLSVSTLSAQQDPGSAAIADSTSFIPDTSVFRVPEDPFYRDTLYNDTFSRRNFRALELLNIPAIPESPDAKLPPSGTMKPVKDIHNNWRYFCILLLLGMIAASRLVNPAKFGAYFSALLKPKLQQELVQEQNSDISGLSILFSFFTAFAISLPLQFLLEKTSGTFSGYVIADYFLLSIGLFLCFMLKYLADIIVGHIMEIRETVTAAIFTSGILYFIFAMLLLPFFLYALLNGISIISYQYLFFSFLGIGILVLIKIVSVLIQSASRFPHPLFYLILYLCALEIVPWLFLFELVESNLK